MITGLRFNSVDRNFQGGEGSKNEKAHHIATVND